MNAHTLLETILLFINLYQAYRACMSGMKCGVAVAIFLLNLVTYMRIRVDESVASLAVPIAVLVALLVMAE